MIDTSWLLTKALCKNTLQEEVEYIKFLKFIENKFNRSIKENKNYFQNHNYDVNKFCVTLRSNTIERSTKNCAYFPQYS